MQTRSFGEWTMPGKYLALSVTNAGSGDATEWAIFEGTTDMENYAGTIIHFIPEDVWHVEVGDDEYDGNEYHSAEEAFHGLMRDICRETAEFIVRYSTDHEDDASATRVCREHLHDSVMVHLASREQSEVVDVIISTIVKGLDLFCERDDL
jgi:hypothetical protein